jgi:hypothetical protein
MSSMLDYRAPHLWDPDQYLGAEVLAGCVQKEGEVRNLYSMLSFGVLRCFSSACSMYEGCRRGGG